MQAPDVILDKGHTSFYTQTQSPNERIYLEFYQILSEEAFDPAAARTNFSSMRLIQQITVPLKHVPFKREVFDGIEYSVAQDHTFLINMPDSSGLVAEMGFDFRYMIQVAPELRCRPIGFRNDSVLFFKMVQLDDEFAFHHDKDLDKHVFSMRVENLTSSLVIEKRLFFNKANYQIGFINVSQNDEIEITTTVIKNGQTSLASEDAKPEVIQKYKFQVQGEYLRGKSENCAMSPPVQLLTWAPTQISMLLNYDGQGKDYVPSKASMFGGFTSNSAIGGGFTRGILTVSGGFKVAKKDPEGDQQQSNGGEFKSMLANVLKQSVATTKDDGRDSNQSRFGRTSATGFHKQDSRQPGGYILEGICLELEARSSYFTTLYNKGWLDCAQLNVRFDPENTYELVMARDLTENAQFEL